MGQQQRIGALDPADIFDLRGCVGRGQGGFFHALIIDIQLRGCQHQQIGLIDAEFKRNQAAIARGGVNILQPCAARHPTRRLDEQVPQAQRPILIGAQIPAAEQIA